MRRSLSGAILARIQQKFQIAVTSCITDTGFSVPKMSRKFGNLTLCRRGGIYCWVPQVIRLRLTNKGDGSREGKYFLAAWFYLCFAIQPKHWRSAAGATLYPRCAVILTRRSPTSRFHVLLRKYGCITTKMPRTKSMSNCGTLTPIQGLQQQC